MSQNSHKFKKQADSRVAKYDIFAYQIHYLSKDNLNIYI